MPIQYMLARKFFSRRVLITGGTAISYANLMRNAPAVTGTSAWGTNSDGSPSMDSFTGDGATLIPVSSTVYVGYDAQVKDADGAANYMGVPATAGTPFNLQDFIRGPIDTDNVFLYCAADQLIDLIFLGI